MRGNLRLSYSLYRDRWPIPAHAGEPRYSNLQCPSDGAYPRACGGTYWINSQLPIDSGLSPRMRGNLWQGKTNLAPVGPIPAHAGEPWKAAVLPLCGRAYPRACGGTLSLWVLLWPERGLSPRMRGNRKTRWLAAKRAGPIPAHAGEPSSCSRL